MSKADDEEDRKRTRHIDVALGLRLRAIREDRGLTQAEMAQKLDISTNQWGRHESGHNRVPAARLWQFCATLGVDIKTVFRDQPLLAERSAGSLVVDLEAPISAAAVDVSLAKTDAPARVPPVEAKGALVQRIGAIARELSESRQRTALAVMRALKAEEEG